MDSGPDFDRIKCALLLGQPDRVPLFECGVDLAIQSAVLDRPVRDLESKVEFWTTTGYDYVPLDWGRTLFDHVQPYSQARNIVKARYSIYEDTHRERDWAEHRKGVITTLDDFRGFPWPSAHEVDYSELDAVGRYLPPKVKVIAMISRLFLWVWRLMGLETFCVSLVEDPDLVERLFDKIGTIQYEVLETITGFDCVGAVCFLDDIAYVNGLMVAPKYLRKHLFPWFKRMSALCRERGLPFIFHSDGDISEVLDDIVECGFNAINPVEPQAMDIVHLKKTVGNKLCLTGNIDLTYTLKRRSPEEVAEETKQRLREIAPGGGYCCGSGTQVSEYVPLEYFNAMRETVLRYGSYPISV